MTNKKKPGLTDVDRTLLTIYAGLVKQFAEQLPRTSVESALASGILTGVVLHTAAPEIMERIGRATSDSTTWASLQKSAASWADALRAAHEIDLALAERAGPTPH